MTIVQPFVPVIRKLERLVELSEGDRTLIAGLPFRTQAVPNGHYLLRERERPTECCMLVSGYVARHKITSAGDRQIVAFHLPGDLLDVQHLFLEIADHNLQTITPASVIWVPSEALCDLIRQSPAISAALWREALIDASMFREWVLNVGRRDARGRVAHTLCEFAARRRAAGLGDVDRFELPMTQEQLADATGLTPVHVNRTLQALGAEGVIDRERRQIRIADWDRLQRLADFDPAYLHMLA